MAAAGYPAVVDRDGVRPEPSSDVEELNRRRAGIAVGWATVEAQNRRRRRSYGHRVGGRHRHRGHPAPADLPAQQSPGGHGSSTQ
jgi:hypothetical protein